MVEAAEAAFTAEVEAAAPMAAVVVAIGNKQASRKRAEEQLLSPFLFN